MTGGLNGRAQLRLAELQERLDQAVAAIAEGSPGSAGPAGDGLRDLHDRLLRVHEPVAEVDDRTWTAYLTGLDRGLAELAAELAGDGSGRTTAVEELVYSRAARLEVDGWALRLDLAGRDAPTEGRELVAGAAREIDEYHAAITAGDAPSRAAVERALGELRGAAG